MKLEKEYEINAKKYFDQKQFKECLKVCFTCISINPSLQWIYDLCGYSYLNLGMWSQSRGSFYTSKTFENNQNKIKNYNKLIELCDEREKESSN